MSQTNKSSYKKMFSLLDNDEEDLFEHEIIKRIKADYDRFHKHDFLAFEKLLNENEIVCPKCGSTNFISHGFDKNKTKRYKCKECNSTFNEAKNTLFFSSKINLEAWFVFLECLLSGSSTSEACINAKISKVTGSKWMKKIFITLKNYQDSILLNNGDIYIDETYIHVDESKTYRLEEEGKIKKVKKLPRGISRNMICILVATDTKVSFAEIVCLSRPQRLKNYNICKKHILPNSHLISDEDNSLVYTINELNLTRTQIKSNTEEAYKTLEPVDKLCSRLKFFIDKHRGFKKDGLQDYLNLFIYIDNETHKENDLYKVTVKLLKMMFSYTKSK
jgi:transposase-like protein